MSQLKKRIEALKVESKDRVQETSRSEILGGLRENMYLKVFFTLSLPGFRSMAVKLTPSYPRMKAEGFSLRRPANPRNG